MGDVVAAAFVLFLIFAQFLSSQTRGQNGEGREDGERRSSVSQKAEEEMDERNDGVSESHLKMILLSVPRLARL